MANTIIYREEWKTKLQEQLDEMKVFKKICKVEFTDSKVIHNPYQNDSTASSYTRGAQYSYSDVTVTDESINIATSYVAPEFIDRADLAQAGFDMQMERAERQADALLDQVETDVLKEHANAGNAVDDGDLATATNGGAGNALIPSTSNILEVVRKARTKIVEDAGLRMLNKQGASIVWDPATFDLLVGAAQGNGFAMADEALKSGRVAMYGGFTHFESNLLETASSVLHCLGTVNGAIHVGILNTTFGDIVVDDKDPNLQSGIGIVSRVDYAVKTWNNMAPLVVDINIDAS